MIIIPIVFCIIGIGLAIFSLYSSHKTIRKRRLLYGIISVCILFIGGWIIIKQIYAKQTPPSRIFQQHLEEDYPTRPLDVSYDK